MINPGKVLVLSDINAWPTFKDFQIIKPQGSIEFKNILELADTPNHFSSIDQRHQYLVEEGINKAVKKLLPMSEFDMVFGFSVGGTIAWKACVEGMSCNKLVCVSSTRLRYEINRPKVLVKLIFGENDEYKPKLEWFDRMKLDRELYPNGGHEFYTTKKGLEFLKGWI